MRIRIKVQLLNIASTNSDSMQMGSLRLFVTFLTILLQINLIYSTASCPSGDTSGVVKNGKTCSQLISSTNYECYDATIETSCCATCNAIATGISGCQYGDKVANCISVLCPFYTDPSECCSTCLTTTTLTTTTTSTTTTRTTTTTTTTTTATTITTGSTSHASSSLSTSTGVIAGAVVGSIAATGLMVGLTYRLVCFSTGLKSRRAVSSSTTKEDLIDNIQAKNSDSNSHSDANADSHSANKRQSNGVISRVYANGVIFGKSKSLPPLETKVTVLPSLPNIIISKPPVLIAPRT